jgi:hypothetical protein
VLLQFYILANARGDPRPNGRQSAFTTDQKKWISMRGSGPMPNCRGVRAITDEGIAAGILTEGKSL